MTAASAVAASRPHASAGRIGAYAVVTACATLYAVGLVLWAGSPATQEATLLWHLQGWSAAGLHESLDALGLSITTAAAYVMLLDLVAAAVGIAAALLVLRQGTTWFRLALGAVLALWATTGGVLGEVYQHTAPTHVAAVVAMLPAFGWLGFILMAYLFPDGRFVPAWTRWCALALAAFLLLLLVIDLTGRVDSADSPVTLLPLLAFFATATYAAVHRYRTSGTQQRRQVRGVMAALVLWVALIFVRIPFASWLEEPGPGALVASGAYLLPSFGVVVLVCLSVVAAILRHNLYDVDPWVNRALVYGGLTALVAILYAVVAGVGAVIWPGSGLAGPLAAALVLAAVLHPLRLRLQRVVDRFVYGHALEPRTLLAEVRESRERILQAREDERARLQRDLHDGLGPTLASLYQRVDAARTLIATDPAAAERLLDVVGSETRAVIGEIRSLVRALRPPELDELGLAGAVEAAAGRLDGVEARVVAGDLSGMPKVVESAAYRIATEALTNVARHARATSAQVTLDHDGSTLWLVVTDDGVGVGRAPTGTGVRSMRERAGELGGTLTVEPTLSGGTVLTAALPCELSQPHDGDAHG